MRRFVLFTLVCFCSCIVFSQKLEIEKASPFSAVKWVKELPIVQFENEWYHFEKIEHLNKDEILAYCKEQFGQKWQKRFSEDLVEVLQGMGYQPDLKVAIQLGQNGVLKTYTGTFTSENRRSSHQYNQTIETATKSINTARKNITVADALADIREFETLLNASSSYTQLSSFDYSTALKILATDITKRAKAVDINEFTHELSKIMSEIGDRHSSIKNVAFHSNAHKTYQLKLPFGVTAVDGKIIAVKQNETDDAYSYYYNSYSYIKAIDGIAIETLINTYNYRDKKAPTAAKITRGCSAIQNYGALLFKNNVISPTSVNVTFSNGATEKEVTVALTTDKNSYVSKLNHEYYALRDNIENGDFNSLSKNLKLNIGYIAIPEMFSYEKNDGLEKYFENTLKGFSDTKALIIDVRNNPGGLRDILQTFAAYIVQPNQSPWIANVAYLKSDTTRIDGLQSMKKRYLYPYNSAEFNAADRLAIDQFKTHFKPQKSFDSLKFSSPFYMVLHHGKESYTQPVYILVNEKSFSAATVFASAFKGLPNVKIVGETTDGSSGNSITRQLQHSNIRVKIATMLSFQRNGKTLDGNGTDPDINISVDDMQVLKGFDYQLNQLVEMISKAK